MVPLLGILRHQQAKQARNGNIMVGFWRAMAGQREGRKEARFPRSGFGLGAGQGKYFAHQEPKTPNLPNLP